MVTGIREEPTRRLEPRTASLRAALRRPEPSLASLVVTLHRRRLTRVISEERALDDINEAGCWWHHRTADDVGDLLPSSRDSKATFDRLTGVRRCEKAQLPTTKRMFAHEQGEVPEREC
jgi:hypothetical protein